MTTTITEITAPQVRALQRAQRGLGVVASDLARVPECAETRRQVELALALIAKVIGPEDY